MKPNTNITITRQYGSGGREIAEIIAKKLKLHRYDRKIVQMAAEQMEETGDISNILQDSYTAPDSGMGSLGTYAYEAVPFYNKMFREQARVILEIAKKGSAVYLGRCADYILKDLPETYSFYIYADDEFRMERAKDHYEGHTLKDLNGEDKNRRRYYEYYTGRTFGDPQIYDLMINTSKISLEKAADLIIQYIELRQQAKK